jgi:hypothetical protein
MKDETVRLGAYVKANQLFERGQASWQVQQAKWDEVESDNTEDEQ